MTFSSVVWSLTTPFAMMALGSAPQVDAQDPNPPTAIEQALIERTCSAVPSGRTFETDPHVRCLGAQIALLRADFGRDLRRLSTSERNMLDSACSRLQTTQGREAYLDCITGQLTALRNRRNRANRAAAEPAPLAAPPPSALPPEAPPAQPASSRRGMIVGGALVVIAVIAASAFVVIRGRRARRTCRDCGAVVPDSGNLCATCRHAAAEALRRVTTERLAQERAADEQERRQRALEEEQRRQAARQEEDARLREHEEARQREEEARQREEDARRRQAEDSLRQNQRTAVSHQAQEAFDPYAVLGVPHDTTPERIRAAYEAARSKYDEDSVAHLGVDVQEHFRAKAQAVDRAYQMLAG
jgi:hypothetical protein